MTTGWPFLMQIIVHNSMTVEQICTKLGTVYPEIFAVHNFHGFHG